MSKIGIVTVLYKSEAVLEDFFLSVASQTHTDYVLYIVDNSPSKESELLINKYCEQHQITDKTKHLPSSGNIGVAAGNNVGIKASLKDNCDYILLSNNDILITDKFLFENMVAEANKNDKKILVPKIYFYKSKDFWFITGYINKFTAKCYHQHNYELDKGQCDDLIVCDYAPTCFMLLKKEVFEIVGLMDEKYFVYYDDTDFLWRCKENKIKVNLFLNGCMEHKEGRSTGGNTSDFSFYYFTRNRFYFSNKINRNILVKTLSLTYVFLISSFSSIKHKKTSIYFKIIKEFYKGTAFKSI